MSTLRDLLIVYNEIDLAFSFFRASDNAVRRFNDLADEARDAIMEEQWLKSSDEAFILPHSTPLGERAQAALEALKSFCPQR